MSLLARLSSGMRVCSALASLALTAHVIACAPKGAGPDLVEPDPSPSAWSEAQPEAKTHAGPEQPRLELARFDPNLHTDYEEGICPYVVERHGFPAMSEDGSMIVVATVQIMGEGEASDFERMVIDWLGHDSTRGETVYDRSRDPWNEDDPAGCRTTIATVAAAVERQNAALAQRSWRPLEPQPVVFAEAQEDGWSEELALVPPPERPVAVNYDGDQLVARIPSDRVLQHERGLDWLSRHECGGDLHLQQMWADLETGVALFSFYISVMCEEAEDSSDVARIELGPELVRELGLRTVD